MNPKPSSHSRSRCQQTVVLWVPALVMLVMGLIVSCKREGEVQGKETKALRRPVPEVKLVVKTWKVGGDLVVWLNREPLGILQGPLTWVEASDLPLKEGVNEVRVAGPSVQDLTSDDLPCVLVIKGEATEVQLTFAGPQERTGGFRLRPEEWKAGMEPGVLGRDSAGKLVIWSLSMVEALRHKDSARLKTMVEGFEEMNDADASPFLNPTTPPVTFAVTSADQLEVYQGPSMVLVTARPDPQTGASRALIEAKADKVEWTMKQVLMLRGRDGHYYLDTPLGWKRILTLPP